MRKNFFYLFFSLLHFSNGFRSFFNRNLRVNSGLYAQDSSILSKLLDLESTLAPNDVGLEPVFYNIGILFCQENKLDNAKVYLTKAKAINPNRTSTHIHLAQISETMNDVESAVASYELVIKNFGSDELSKVAYNNLVAIWLSQRQLDKAVEVTNRFLTLYPIEPTALCAAGVVSSEMGEIDKSIQFFQTLLKISNASNDGTALIVTAYNNLAQLFSLTGDLEKAEEAYGKVIEGE